MPTRRPKKPSRSSTSSSRPSRPSRERREEDEDAPPARRSNRAPKKEEISPFAYIGIALAVMLLLSIGYLVINGSREDISQKLKKEQTQAEEKEKKDIALFSLNKNRNSETKETSPKNSSNSRSSSSSLFADEELEAKRMEEEAKQKAEEAAEKAKQEAKQKAEEEAKKAGEIPEFFDFLPDTSIGDKAKIKGLCEQLIGDNYRDSDAARAQLIQLSTKSIPMIINALKAEDVRTDEGGVRGNVLAQTLEEMTEKNIGYEGIGSPASRHAAKMKWIEWWNEERKKYQE